MTHWYLIYSAVAFIMLASFSLLREQLCPEYSRWRLTTRSRDVSKPRDWVLLCSYRSEIFKPGKTSVRLVNRSPWWSRHYARTGKWSDHVAIILTFFHHGLHCRLPLWQNWVFPALTKTYQYEGISVSPHVARTGTFQWRSIAYLYCMCTVGALTCFVVVDNSIVNISR